LAGVPPSAAALVYTATIAVGVFGIGRTLFACCDRYLADVV
jgi:hypothetical protein